MRRHRRPLRRADLSGDTLAGFNAELVAGLAVEVRWVERGARKVADGTVIRLFAQSVWVETLKGQIVKAPRFTPESINRWTPHQGVFPLEGRETCRLS